MRYVDRGRQTDGPFGREKSLETIKPIPITKGCSSGPIKAGDLEDSKKVCSMECRQACIDEPSDYRHDLRGRE